jgi:lactoylglutathione lyase
MFASGFVNLYTSDIEAGLRLYRDLLGLTNPSGPRRTGLGTAEAAVTVHGVDAAAGPPTMEILL